MSSNMVDYSTHLAQKVHTLVPKLQELKNILEKGMKKHFKEVDVEIVPCPSRILKVEKISQ